MNKGTTPHYDSLWKLMKERIFIADPDSIHDDLTCVLCKNLMVDACQTPCGCKYCYKCISDYLRDGNKCCPGEKCQSNVDLLIAKNHILRDPKLNLKIWNLKVLCPNISCQFKAELSIICDHLKACQYQRDTTSSTEAASIIEEDKIPVYPRINTEALVNLESIMDNMKNDFNGFKVSLEKNNLEIESLKEALRIKDTQIREIQLSNEELRKKEVEFKSLQGSFQKNNSELKSLKEALQNRNMQMQDIGNLKEELRSKEKKIAALETRMEFLNKERSKEQNKIKVNASTLETLMINKMALIESKHDILERKLIYYTNCKRLCPNLEVDFAWKFEDLSTSKGEDLLSVPFFSNDYRFMLKLNRGNRGMVSLWCYLMSGVNDNNVCWPMDDKVTLSILDQDTMQPFISNTYDLESYPRKYKYAFFRPKYEVNQYGIGSYNFCRYSEIRNSPSVMLNDAIIVTVSLNNGDDNDGDNYEDDYFN